MRQNPPPRRMEVKLSSVERVSVWTIPSPLMKKWESTRRVKFIAHFLAKKMTEKGIQKQLAYGFQRERKRCLQKSPQKFLSCSESPKKKEWRALQKKTPPHFLWLLFIDLREERQGIFFVFWEEIWGFLLIVRLFLPSHFLKKERGSIPLFC